MMRLCSTPAALPGVINLWKKKYLKRKKQNSFSDLLLAVKLIKYISHFSLVC